MNDINFNFTILTGLVFSFFGIFLDYKIKDPILKKAILLHYSVGIINLSLYGLSFFSDYVTNISFTITNITNIGLCIGLLIFGTVHKHFLKREFPAKTELPGNSYFFGIMSEDITQSVNIDSFYLPTQKIDFDAAITFGFGVSREDGEKDNIKLHRQGITY